jgi:zinc protease
MTRIPATLVALALASCARPIERPLVPPLRYTDDSPMTNSPTEDASFRTSAPDVAIEPAIPRMDVQPFALDNGLHGLVVVRRGFPMIAARLVIDTRPVEGGDVGGRNASLLAGLFLAPPEGILRTGGGCGTVQCVVASGGTSDQLGEVLGRIGGLVTREDRPDSFYARRLEELAPLAMQSKNDPSRSLPRIAAALLFGQHHRYGQSEPGPAPTLDDLRALRRRAFDPKRATLIVVGDVSVDDVFAETTHRFGEWQAGAAPVESVPDPLPPLSGARFVAQQLPAMVQMTGAIVARGPAPTDGDSVAFEVLAYLLGGTPDAEAWQHVREEMTAAYSVGASVQWYPDVSVLTLSGSLSPEKAIDAMARLIESIRAVREEGPDPQALERAKHAALAGWRQAVRTDEGIAGTLGGIVLDDIPIRDGLDFPERVRTIQAADVQAAARRFLAVSALRLVLIGDPNFMVEAQALRFGVPIRVDGFGQPI